MSLTRPKLSAAQAVRPRRVRWSLVVGFWLLVLGMLGFDAWWLWRDSRSTVPIAKIRSMISAGQTLPAKSALREILRRSPNDGDARMQLARVLGAEGDYLGCAKELHLVPAWWPNKAEAAYLEGQSFKALDRMREAEAAWNVCNSYDPLHPTPPKFESAANIELMELYAYEERWEDAHRVIWNAYENAPPIDHGAILVMRIRTEMERIAPASSVIVLRRFVAADPLDWEARLALGRAEGAIGRPDEAMKLVKDCLDERPQELRAWREWLALLFAQGNLPALASAIARLPQGASGDPEIWKLRGMEAEKRQDWNGAADAYREALRIKPSEAEYHYKLSVVEERVGRPEVAKDHRRRNQELRALRGKLSTTFEAYLEADKKGNGSPERSLAIQELADLCDGLGWERVARGWRGLISTNS
jgi:tetratricopeptide (TPR) repeat protein